MQQPTPLEPAKTRQLSRAMRLLRLVSGVIDPRAWLHVLKLVNYYNYAHVVPRRHVRFGPDAAISPNAVFANPQRISAGKGLKLASRCQLMAGPSRGRIVIGDDVLFGPDVLVTAASYRFDDGRPVSDQYMDEADVIIGNDVWLGGGVIVLAGSTIGDGSIIGAGSVVRGAIPPMSVAVGAPARVVRMREAPSAGPEIA